MLKEFLQPGLQMTISKLITACLGRHRFWLAASLNKHLPTYRIVWAEEEAFSVANLLS